MLLNQLASGPGRLHHHVSPPPVRGIGTAGGFKMRCRTRAAATSPQLEARGAVRSWRAANQTPGLASVFTTFNTRTPKI